MAAMMKTAASIGRAAVGNVSPDATAVDGASDMALLAVVSVSCSTCSWLLGDAAAATGRVGEAAPSVEAGLFAVVTGAPRRMPPPVDAISFTCPLLSSSAFGAADGSFISDASSSPFPATLPLSEGAVAASGRVAEAASPPVTLASSDDNSSTISLRCCIRVVHNLKSHRVLVTAARGHSFSPSTRLSRLPQLIAQLVVCLTGDFVCFLELFKLRTCATLHLSERLVCKKFSGEASYLLYIVIRHIDCIVVIHLVQVFVNKSCLKFGITE
ncbi:uncharacterized protein BcabD6B2_11320 [Babesia caballi]|uniref:Secreted protein n=1 Tax=Babesia caballi TaxID=5871 RepID=A0AAV4LPK3_BABCB|nr:hypothetical protein BcabD6B2_11320 [Babesia caballi]